MEKIAQNKEIILESIQELVKKGVQVNWHDSFIEKQIQLTLIHGCSVGQNNSLNNKGEIKILKKIEGLYIDIFLNSSEEEITNQINQVKSDIRIIEENSKTSAIVDFLREKIK